MPRPRDALGLVTAAVLAACTPAPESRPTAPPPGEEAARTAPPPSPPPGRTANQDARGFANQPDYAAEAALLKEQVTPRLPSPLPKDRRQACAAMFARADELYREIDPDSESRERTLASLQATRASDLAACERETSVRAAACVAARLGDRDAELPWLIDQCERAFPD